MNPDNLIENSFSQMLFFSQIIATYIVRCTPSSNWSASWTLSPRPSPGASFSPRQYQKMTSNSTTFSQPSSTPPHCSLLYQRAMLCTRFENIFSKIPLKAASVMSRLFAEKYFFVVPVALGWNTRSGLGTFCFLSPSKPQQGVSNNRITPALLAKNGI